jgi:hypothetical protein
MAEVLLDIEWGEQPFTAGKDAWPSPLIRPEIWQSEWDESLLGPKIIIPDALLERYRRMETEFIACQGELARYARNSGMLA